LLMKPLAIRNLAVAIREVMDRSAQDRAKGNGDHPPGSANGEEGN
jgi:hypothetical protein